MAQDLPSSSDSDAPPDPIPRPPPSDGVAHPVSPPRSFQTVVESSGVDGFHRGMLLIEARCDRSPVHGLGLFACRAIPAGTPVWRFVAGFDQSFSVQDAALLPEPARRHLAHYGFLDDRLGRWFLDADLAIFMNHSETPNTGAPECRGPASETRALRDIAAGEELTCDYRAFDGSAKPIPPPPSPRDPPAFD